MAEIVRMVFGRQGREDGRPTREQEEAVEEHVRHVATDVHDNLREQAASPKLQDEVGRLQEIAGLARELQRKLAGLDGLTRDLLQADLRHLQRPRRLVGQPPAPVPSAALAAKVTCWDADSPPPLEALARAADGTRGFIEQWAAAPSGPGLKRGVGNLRTHLVGDLRIHLTSECAKLLGAFQGARAITATEGGKLHLLAAAVWRYATGLDVEAAGGGGFPGIVKRVALPARRLQEAHDAAATAPDEIAAAKELLRVETEARELMRRPPARARRNRAGQVGISARNPQMPP